MKRTALTIFMFALSAFLFYCAYYPDRTRQYFNVPISASLRKRLLFWGGLFFSLLGLVSLYAAFMPTVSQD